MTTRIIAALCIALALGTATAVQAGAPLVISGQTQMAAGSAIDNPKPAAPGAIGEITELPYQVPPGRTACVTSYGIEGYDAAGIGVLFIWTGAPATVTAAWRVARALPSVAAKGGSSEFVGLNFCFPAGTVLNVRLINGQQLSAVYGWYVVGHIKEEG